MQYDCRYRSWWHYLKHYYGWVNTKMGVWKTNEYVVIGDRCEECHNIIPISFVPHVNYDGTTQGPGWLTGTKSQ